MPNISSPFTIIYIVGMGHSGSTLLDLLLGSNSSVISLGEIDSLSNIKKCERKNVKQLKPIIETKCTCGAKSKLTCDFWKKVNARMMEKYRVSLWEADLYNEDTEIFKLHNYSLLESISFISGCKYIVDSSKRLSRLLRLLNTGIFDIKPVHLVRNIHGICYSNIKKQRNYVSTALITQQETVLTKSNLSGRDHIYVTYENLVGNPNTVIKNIMDWIGSTFEEDQMNWSDHEHHIIAGNHMRHLKNNEIKPDYEWIQKLSISQKIIITFISIFGRYYYKLKYSTYQKIREFFK